MALTALDSQQSLQATEFVTQGHKSVSVTRSSHDGPDKTKEQQTPHASPSIQDQVTLSKEAQELSTSTPQPSKNSTFQQSPSPFDQ